MRTLMADSTMGRNRQITVLLAAMSVETIEVPENTRVTTYPYCNCREQGFVLSISNNRDMPTNLAFYEHRNSDSLCVIQWKGHINITGACTPSDIPSEAFPDKWSVTKRWKYMNLEGPIDYVKKVLKDLEYKPKVKVANRG